jgi:hypothetical protein
MNPVRSALPTAILGAIVAGALAAAEPSPEVAAFTDRHCSSCHNDVDREGGLDLTTLAFNPADAGNFLAWVKVHDRVQAGEMPPKEKRRPAANETTAFLRSVSRPLIAFEESAFAREGRATRRRLNREEYEHALRDLLQIPLLQVKELLPEDGEAHRFNKVSQALDVSHVHVTRYMNAAEYALRQVLAIRLDRPPTTTKRYYARDETNFTRLFRPTGRSDRMMFPLLDGKAQPELRVSKGPFTVGESDPATREREAVGWVHSNYVTGFSSQWTNFRVPVTGRYRLRFSGYTAWVAPFGANIDKPQLPARWYIRNFDEITPGRRQEPITLYAQGPLQNRRIGAFDLSPETTVTELDATWLLANETIVTDASRFYRSRPTGHSNKGESYFTNPLSQRDGAPAVAFRWMEVEGPLYDDTIDAGYRLLFGELPLQPVEAGGVAIEVGTRTGGRGGRAGRALGTTRVEVTPGDQAADAHRLLRQFIQRAYRRPAEEREVQRFLALVRERENAGLGFLAAMLAGYTAVLSSPEFVYLEEKPGPLDDYALATRLSLFLWNSEPDAPLRQRAARGELRQPAILRAETERLLRDPKAQRFVESFLNYWLELRRIEETTPSNILYPDYYLDDMLTEAALAETRLFFGELLEKNLPTRLVVDADFTFVNEHLAQHYRLAGVAGVAMRRVALPAGSARGGLLTQASVLKVTANGTTTSPVLRGKWIGERILGVELPPPPASVPAVEPDIRGAVTIRQQLARHSADESCAMCHRKIDPPGFALESFDVMGAWRDRYRAESKDQLPEFGFGKNGWAYDFFHALPVDPSGALADGRAFADVKELKRHLLADETQLARNLAHDLRHRLAGPLQRSRRHRTDPAAVQGGQPRGARPRPRRRPKRALPQEVKTPRISLAVLSLLAALAGGVARAAEPASTAPTELTAEQKTALVSLDALLARFDQLLAKVGDAKVRADTQAVLDGHKARRTALNEKFDQGRYEELRLDVNTEAQRVALWLAPLRTPPPPAPRAAAP